MTQLLMIAFFLCHVCGLALWTYQCALRLRTKLSVHYQIPGGFCWEPTIHFKVSGAWK